MKNITDLGVGDWIKFTNYDKSVWYGCITALHELRGFSIRWFKEGQLLSNEATTWTHGAMRTHCKNHDVELL